MNLPTSEKQLRVWVHGDDFLPLGLILLDWGWKSHKFVWMDATAGIAIGSGRGLARVKHIDTVFLWVQTMVTEGEVTIGKKPTKEMLVDFLTKHVDAATMLNCMTGLGMKFQSGESTLTLEDRLHVHSNSGREQNSAMYHIRGNAQWSGDQLHVRSERCLRGSDEGNLATF